jgi:hypothetical protein
MSWVGYAWYDKPFEGSKEQKAKNFASHNWVDSDEVVNIPKRGDVTIMVCLVCGAKTSSERSDYKCGTRVPRITAKEYLKLKLEEN